MPIQVHWDNDEKTILRYDFESTWSWEDLYHVLDQANQMVNEAGYDVVAISDMSTSALPPAGALQNIKNAIIRQNSHVKLNIIISSSHYIPVLMETFGKIYNAFSKSQPVHFARNREHAYEIIEKFRQ